MSFEALKIFGWNEFFATQFQPFLKKNYLPGRISFQNQHLYRVYTEQGEIQAEVAGKLRYHAENSEDLPAVGDWVALRFRGEDNKGVIQAVLPRQSKFARKTAGAKTEAQIVGANINVIFLVTSLNQDFNPRRIERYLTNIWDSGSTPVVILSKSDLCQDESELIAARTEVESISFGVAVHAISVKENSGTQALLQYCGEGETLALIGTSGVGKSTIINYLLGYEKQEVKDVRTHDDRGQHTTRHRELIVLPQGGLILDTPGMREMQLWDVASGIETAFDEIEALAAHCHFSNCQHQQEPRCAVQEALAAGQLDSQRFENYVKLQREVHHLALRQDDLARRMEQKKWKKLSRLAKERSNAKRKGA